MTERTVQYASVVHRWDPATWLSRSSQGFFVAALLYLGPTFFLAWLLHVMGHPVPAPPIPAERSAATNVLLVVLLGPLIETAILVAPTKWASSVVGPRRPWVASLLGAVPLVLLHAQFGWPKSLAVSWMFLWSARCYLELRQRGAHFTSRYLFVFALHAAGNAIGLSAIYFP